ncbi:hypothetical protein [Alloyangia pacifica]|uniref:Uncharacterized protein n=1 Tax=Alloyangia pacifica TaxID=311180 RepID=A0A1I6SYX0_9RHOB|nr:hypothetical protein [Alloyangia pacifica]SDG91658.1 hypothetical protein SAMN04488245_105149 [Alloyangia pacifica]SFS82053.1 hypothetical protein SAMN04488050_105149 [Alloyangia pacifica]
MSKTPSQSPEEADALEPIGAPLHMHTDRIDDATHHFVRTGGIVHWLGASLLSDARRQCFVMQSYEGGEHSLPLHDTDAERLQAHWRAFLQRHLIVVEELSGRTG